MALVRCPIHNIPYNADNPRGCPACAAEKEGGGSASVMQELKRVSRVTRGLPIEPEPPAAPAAPVKSRSSAFQTPPLRASVEVQTPPPEDQLDDWPPPVTRQPTPPTTPLSRWRRTRLYLRRHPPVAALIFAGTAGFAWLLWAVVPRFSEQFDPPPATEDARPLPLRTGQPITSAFVVLGVEPPTVHPADRRLARHLYGDDLAVDEYNGFIYDLTLMTPYYSWSGLRVGMSEQNASGVLALLGPLRESQTKFATPTVVGGYDVYPTRDDRPERSLAAQVRPPNGCFDAEARLRPLIVGVVRRGSQSYVAVAEHGNPVTWLVTTVRLVDRHLPGPDNSAPPC